MKKRYSVPLILIVFSVILTFIGRTNRQFADFYATNIFPYISSPFVFLNGLFPFSIGEILVASAVILVTLGIPLMIIIIIFNKKSRLKTAFFSLSFALWALAFVMTTETLNCFILYGCTTFSERYFESKTHSQDELVKLYEIIIEKANSLADEVPRDENNRFILTADAQTECVKAMKKASETYPQLRGYYPEAKPVIFSFFMSQSNLLGIYFPFSMESAYNKDMVSTNLPQVLCHEFAHLKGFMQEDEANFVSFIATSLSDNNEVQYSGYLDALEYVHNQIYKNKIAEGCELTDSISEKVKNDWFRFVPDDYWNKNQHKEIISTETVKNVSDKTTDTSLKVNGVDDGIQSYSRMVNLLLDYYFPYNETIE